MSWRRPSAAKKTALVGVGAAAAGLPTASGTASSPAATAIAVTRAAARRRNDILMIRPPDHECTPGMWGLQPPTNVTGWFDADFRRPVLCRSTRRQSGAI